MTIDLNGINTDDQTIDLFDIDPLTNILSLSLEADGVAPEIVNLTPYVNTDDQTLTYTNSDPNDNVNTLQIEGSAAFDIDDNHLGTDDQILTGNRTIGLDGNSITFDGAQDVVIEADGDVGIGTNAPNAKLEVAGGQVRVSEYGGLASPYTNTAGATYQLAVESDGDVVQMNTAKSARVFYAPPMVIPVDMVSANIAGPGDESIDLHQEYVNRFSSPSIIRNPGSAPTIPTYNETELDYYIADYDPAVFGNVAVNDAGILTYDVISIPTGNCTYITVVFVVK